MDSPILALTDDDLLSMLRVAMLNQQHIAAGQLAFILRDEAPDDLIRNSLADMERTTPWLLASLLRQVGDYALRLAQRIVQFPDAVERGTLVKAQEYIQRHGSRPTK